VHLLAARAARLKGEYVKAEGHLNKCLQLSREATEAVQLENLLMRGQRGEVDEVAADLMRLVDSKHPESPLILETISRAYVNHLRFGPALVYLERWIQEAPHSADAYFWRGWSLERLDYLERAFADIQRAVDLAPDRVLFRLQLADMYLERNYTPQALPHLESLRKQCPEIATIQARLGYCRFVLGQEQEGRGLLEAALEKRPDDPALLLYLARVELQEGRFQEAEKWAGRLMQLDPHNQEAQATLVNSLRLQGRQKEAAAAQAQYEKILALWHLSNELLMQETEHPGRDHNRTAEIGRTLLDLGQEPQGLYWLGQALKRDPGHQLAHRVLADYFQKKGDREKAAAHRRWLGGSLR
jgi:tetratricopeptide (TPR) repeat protein